jgi:hypothetical protein
VHLVNGDLPTARRNFVRATQLPKGHPFAEILLWAMDRGSDPDAALSHLRRAKVDLDSPHVQQMIGRFEYRECFALTLCGLGKPDEAVEVLQSAIPTRQALDQYRRPLYDLLKVPEEPKGLSGLLDVWRMITATDPSAAGPWGGPS